MNIQSDGTCSLADIIRVARSYGLRGTHHEDTGARELAGIPLPAVLHLNDRHFVVLAQRRVVEETQEVLVLDARERSRWYSVSELAAQTSGHAVSFRSTLPKLNDKKLVSDFTVYDMGKVRQGEMTKHIFRLTNVTDTPVSITDISTSCHCTTTLFSDERIEAQKSAELEVSFKTEGMPEGLHSNIVMIELDNSKKIAVALAAYVVTSGELQCVPKTVVMQRSREDSQLIANVLVQRNGGGPINPVKVTTSDGSILTVKPEREFVRSGAHLLQLAIAADSASLPKGNGTLSAEVHLETEHEMFRQLTIPVSIIDSPPPVRVTPKEVRMGIIDRGTVVKREISITSVDQEAFLLSDMKTIALPAGMQLTGGTKDTPSTSHRLTIEYDTKKLERHTSTISQRIQIPVRFSQSKKEYQLEIAVKGILRPSSNMVGSGEGR